MLFLPETVVGKDTRVKNGSSLKKREESKNTIPGRRRGGVRKSHVDLD